MAQITEIGNKQMKMSVYVPKLMATIAAYSWLVLTCLLVLVPFLWMVSASFTEGKLLTGVSLVPSLEKLSLEHYQYLFTYSSQTAKEATSLSMKVMNSDFVSSFIRSFMIAVVTVIGQVIFSALSGYVFARFRFAGKKSILIAFLLLNLFPSFMGLIALYQMFKIFGFLNKPLALCILYIGGSIPYNTYLVRGYMRSIGKSIDEAATIDGASKMTIFWKIILPLSTPIIGFIAVNAFMGPWMDYMLPFQVLNQQNQTVAMFLYRLTDPMITLYYNPLNFMAGGLIIGIPITMIQFYTQRFIVYGMTAGAEKG